MLHGFQTLSTLQNMNQFYKRTVPQKQSNKQASSFQIILCSHRWRDKHPNEIHDRHGRGAHTHAYRHTKTYTSTSHCNCVLLMEEILHHLGCMKPCKKLDKLPINWCRISSINSIYPINFFHICLQGSVHIAVPCVINV